MIESIKHLATCGGCRSRLRAGSLTLCTEGVEHAVTILLAMTTPAPAPALVVSHTRVTGPPRAKRCRLCMVFKTENTTGVCVACTAADAAAVSAPRSRNAGVHPRPTRETAHVGDPCRACGVAHDHVAPGPCPVAELEAQHRDVDDAERERTCDRCGCSFFGEPVSIGGDPDGELICGKCYATDHLP